MKGRAALVCGGSRGIGRGIALAFARAGADVAILSRDEASLAKTADEIEKIGRGRAHAIVGDVADADLPRRAVAEVEKAFGRVDVLVNNAGGPPMGSFLEQEFAAWDRAYRTNLLSVVAFTRAAVPSMRTRGFGRVVNVTSIVGKEPSPAMVLSGTFRAGVSAFSKAIATELAPQGITINTVGPAAVLTERAENLTKQTAEREGISYEEALTRATNALPMKRFATLDELASVVLFLSSDAASYVTGTTILVDGGHSKSIF